MNNLLTNIFMIFIGGGCGSVLRYFVSLMKINTNFPFSTLLVNMIGCFIIGFIYSFTINKLQIPENFKLFLTVGFCGGITTFSTFSLENYKLFENGLYIQMFIYIIFSVILSIVITIIGVYCGKQF